MNIPNLTAYSIRIFVLATLLWLISSQVYAAALTATVDRNQLGAGETLELRVKYDAQTSTDPDFSALTQNFDVLSKHQQNQFSFINGSSVSYTEWRLQLLPKKTGQVLIPALSFKGVSSDAIRLSIDDRPKSSSSNQPVYVEAELEKNSVYVQEQLLLTLRILSTTGLQSISSEELMVKDATVAKVAENQFQKQINGINHLVVELTYAIFPDTSGELKIPAIRFKAVIPDKRDPYSNSFFSRGGKRVYLYSEEQKVTVNPKPASYGLGEWLPSKDISMSERWSRPLDELVAGEPVTRTININAKGLTSAQLPPLVINAGDGFKVYPDQPQLDNNVDSDGVTAIRIESVAIVPSRGGQISLPPITLKWWDTTSNKVRETVLKGSTLTVKASENTPAPTSTPSTVPIDSVNLSTAIEPVAIEKPSNLLFLLLGLSNAILLILVIILLLLWRKARNQHLSTPLLPQESNEPKEADLFIQLQQCVKDNDHRGFREGLIAWGSVFWQQPVFTLEEVALLAGTESLKTRLNTLDQSLYRPGINTNIDLSILLDEFKAVRKQTRAEKPSKGKHLKPLYENA
jgi:BatD DUF11 like domain